MLPPPLQIAGLPIEWHLNTVAPAPPTPCEICTSFRLFPNSRMPIRISIQVVPEENEPMDSAIARASLRLRELVATIQHEAAFSSAVPNSGSISQI